MELSESQTRVEVEEIKCLRNLCGVFRFDRVRNGEVRRTGLVEEKIRVIQWMKGFEVVWTC